jgi:hypothetical protein
MSTVAGTPSLRSRYKALRKQILSYTPFIRRGRHEKALVHFKRQMELERREREELGALFLSPPPLAAAVRCTQRIPIHEVSTDELCLFVTHAPKSQLKPHVIDHIYALLETGIHVVLIANTDVDFSELQVPGDLGARLDGFLIRENVGYDFAAWAHAYSLIDLSLVRKRLYLINDSIVGPLDLNAYRRLLQRIRDSTADLVGLTSNPDPHPHLQSFYLVLNERLLHSTICASLMDRIVNLPLKQNVIDCYEIWLSPYLERQGFTTGAMFPKLSARPPPKRNDPIFEWRRLFDLGFPFVKSEVLGNPDERQDACRLLPERYM